MKRPMTARGRSHEWVSPRSRSALFARTATRIPRYAATGVLVILGVVGLRALIAGPPDVPAPIADLEGGRLSARAFAEGFARAYLTYDAARPEARARALALFVGPGLSADAGFRPPDRGRQAVVWSAVFGERPETPFRTTVFVAVETVRGYWRIAVPVETDSEGGMGVADPPALIGSPAPPLSPSISSDRPVSDGAITAVTRRALRNYLRGDAANLSADLADGARVSLLDEPLRGIEVGDIGWADTDRVAVNVRARPPSGGVMELRYEIDLLWSGRWFVRAIHTGLSNNEEVTP